MRERLSNIWVKMLTEFADDLMDGKVVHGAADRAILGAMVKETVERCVASEAALRAHPPLSAEEREGLQFAQVATLAEVNGVAPWHAPADAAHRGKGRAALAILAKLLAASETQGESK